MKSAIAVALLIASLGALGLFRISSRLHEIDQDVDNCSDFLQILSDPVKDEAAKPQVWKTQDSQAAAGEWTIEVQHPPCGSVHNLQVIWPKQGNEDAPVKIECDLMPVKAR